MKKICVLTSVSLLMLSVLSSSAQSTLRVINRSKDTIIVTIEGDAGWLNPDSSTIFRLSRVYSMPPCTIRSGKGDFGSGTTNSTPLPKGEYIMVIMWNPKQNSYRTVVRPYEKEDE